MGHSRLHRAERHAIEAKVHGHWKNDDDRWEAHSKQHDYQDRAHQREHEANQRAIDLAASLGQQAKADANEWRGAMSDRERNFLTRAEADALFAKEASTMTALDIRLDAVEDANLARLTRDQERERAQIRLMALIGVGATVASVVLNLLIRLSLG